MGIQREVSNRAREALGSQIIYQLWKCFDNYTQMYGKLSEESNFTQYVNVSSKMNRVVLRFEREPMKQLYTFECIKEINERIAIISVEDVETIMLEDEANKFMESVKLA